MHPHRFIRFAIVLALAGALFAAALLVAGCGGKPAAAFDPTPTPLPVDQLVVVSVTELDLMAGFAGTSAYLAPSGTHFAYLHRDEMTIIMAAGVPVTRISLEDHIRRIDSESIRWLPDSQRLVMTEEALSSGTDPDIHLVDIVTRDVRNLTDDGVDMLFVQNPDWEKLRIDFAPHGIDGGECIAFIRYTRLGDDFDPPALMTIRSDGSDLTQVGTLATRERLSILNAEWSPDGSLIAYANESARSDSPERGVWIADPDGRNVRKLGALVYESQGTTRTIPFSHVTFSADGQYVLAYSQMIRAVLSPSVDPVTRRLDPQSSPVRVLSVADGTSVVLNEDYYVIGAGWSPDGHALAYLVTDRHFAPDESGLYISSGPGDPGRLVLQGLFMPPTPLQTQPLIWADNHTILLSRSPEHGVVIVQLGVE